MIGMSPSYREGGSRFDSFFNIKLPIKLKIPKPKIEPTESKLICINKFVVWREKIIKNKNGKKYGVNMEEN